MSGPVGFEIRRFGKAADGSEERKDDAFHRVFVFGESGTGKTVAACRAAVDRDLDLAEVLDGKVTPQGDAKMFGLFLERNGLAAARMINPTMGYAFADPFNDEGEPDPAQALGIARAVIRAAASGILAENGFDRLVIDGLTELQRLEKDGISAVNRAEIEAKGERVLREWFDQDDWNWLNEKSRRQLNNVRALPIDTICTALEEIVETKAGAERILPKFEGRKIPGEAMSFFNAVGRMERVPMIDASGRESVSFRTRFSGASNVRIKSCGSITGWQKPCAAAWLDVLAGRLDPKETRIASAVLDVERPADAPPATTSKPGRRTRSARG